MLGHCDWGHADIHCVLCVGYPHCQHSAAPMLFSCTVNLAPSVYNKVLPRLTKIIRSGITSVSRNLRLSKRDFP